MKIDNKISPSKVICPCFDITIAHLMRAIYDNKNISYDEFLTMTNATNKCTACSLDVEYYFTKFKNSNLILEVDADTSFKIQLDNKSRKEKFYEIIDRFTPMVSMMQTNYIPIIVKNKTLDSWIWIANNSMMHEREVFGSKMDVELIVRNHLGDIKHKKKYFLDHEDCIHENVSQFLLKDVELDNNEILAGSLEINRLPIEIGVRGATRPQLEILAKEGSGAVHTQGKGRSGGGGFSCLYRPDTDIIFIAITNTDTNNKNDFSIEYPINNALNFNKGKDIVKDCISIPPRGTILHEVKLGDDYIDQLIHMKWSSTGSKSSYVFCVSTDLSQISIDHVT